MDHAFALFMVAPPRAEERPAALQVFFRHLQEDERTGRVERVTQLLAQGDLHPEGLLACWADGVLVGAMVAAALPGASAIVWPPRTLDGPHATVVEDLLLRHATRWLHERGCKFGQAMLSAAEAPLGPSLQPSVTAINLSPICFT
jgi:hypothetical protein